MNNFTKNELELIKWAVALLTIEEIEDYNCQKSEIMGKVKDMISNYCELQCNHMES